MANCDASPTCELANCDAFPTCELANCDASPTCELAIPFIETWNFERIQGHLNGIENGFTLNSTISISETRVFRNHSSARHNRDAVNEMVAKELAAGRYHGPYTKSQVEAYLGRPFISHPLGAIPKSDGIRWRIIEDLSWPYDPSVPSVNELSDYSDVPVEWGGMAEMIELVVTAKEGAQGATVDWEDAFRQLPISRDELWMGVVQWNVRKGGPNEFYVDGNAKFGHNRSIGSLGQVNKAFTTILQREGLGNVIYWVDDLCIRREPTNNGPRRKYPFGMRDILKVAKILGVPLPKERICEFSNITRYLGFDWYWDSKRVEIPDEKKRKTLEQITTLMRGRCVSKKDLRSLCGYLAHLALAVPEGKARIRGLYDMLASMKREEEWSPSAVQDLQWWKVQLKKPHLGMNLSTQKTPDDSLRVYVDASTSWGIDVIINKKYDRFKLAMGWELTRDGKRRDIGWAEFIAVEVAVFFLISTYHMRQRHILIHSDNQGVVMAWKARRCRNPEPNAVLMRIIRMLDEAEAFISLEWVPSEENPADAASRGGAPVGLKRRFFASLPKHLEWLLSRS